MCQSGPSGELSRSAGAEDFGWMLLLVGAVLTISTLIGIELWWMPNGERNIQAAVAQYVDKHQCSMVAASESRVRYRCNYPEANRYITSVEIRDIVKANLAAERTVSKSYTATEPTDVPPLMVTPATNPEQAAPVEQLTWREKYLERNGCVVADMANGNATRFRCDRPRKETYLSAEELADMARLNQ